MLALRDFRADPERILTSRARVVSRPGKLAALLAEHKPTWVIIDNLRTWCRSMQLDTDNSSAAADAIDPLAEAIRDCGYPVACTIVHNEARSKSEGVVVKGVPGDPYAGRMRNSTVFEDASGLDRRLRPRGLETTDDHDHCWRKDAPGNTDRNTHHSTWPRTDTARQPPGGGGGWR